MLREKEIKQKTRVASSSSVKPVSQNSASKIIKTPQKGTIMKYMVEHARSGRAKCRTCGQKIGLGEYRLGTVANIMEHDTLLWRHFPQCVTKAVLKNIYDYRYLDTSNLSGSERKAVIQLLGELKYE
jgi:hypothetical protein